VPLILRGADPTPPPLAIYWNHRVAEMLRFNRWAATSCGQNLERVGVRRVKIPTLSQATRQGWGPPRHWPGHVAGSRDEYLGMRFLGSRLDEPGARVEKRGLQETSCRHKARARFHRPWFPRFENRKARDRLSRGAESICDKTNNQGGGQKCPPPHGDSFCPTALAI
jgi:hypothetical protein